MIDEQLGVKIKHFRRKNKLTLAELGDRINKSESTISKYEKGVISLDVYTLYEIATALNVDIQQLLIIQSKPSQDNLLSKDIPAFFNDIDRMYTYVFDGRTNELMRSVIDIYPANEEDELQSVYMYMNFTDFEAYQDCETTFKGHIYHYDAVTNIHLNNMDTQMEYASINVLASYQDAPTKWAKFNGLSSRPIMPVSSKMLLSKDIIKEDKALYERLKISKNDLRRMQQYNSFSVV